MNAATPKQFLLLAGKPVLMHSIEAFHKVYAAIPIIVALPEDLLTTWDDLCHQHHFNIRHKLVKGGSSRFHSVKNALAVVDREMLVGIHDGVRPLVSPELIKRVFNAATVTGHAVPTISFNESVRMIDHDSNHPVNRNLLQIIQTPQVFLSSLIKKAYDQPYRDDFTDDATVLETLGITIRLVEGDRDNIKITTRQDLLWAEALLSADAS
jgi:2-C-methyl-D-erythritol 4-phosphate cytidylyltransferase